MNLSIESQAVPYKIDPKDIVQVLDHLVEAGYEPLITIAKQKSVEVFGGLPGEAASIETSSAEVVYDYITRRMASRYREEFRIPVAGDLFYAGKGKGILYLALMVSDPASIRRRSKESPIETYLEIGYVGDEAHKGTLEDMKKVVSEFLATTEVEAAWAPIQPICPPFIELRQSQDSKFVLANSLTEQELQLAEQLEDLPTRNLAIVIKRSGGVLASDLTKKSGVKPKQVESIIERLSNAHLVAKEYVVICKKTSNQVNRVDSKEKIEKMTEIGVMCSCGNPIEQERIEVLFSPTQALQKMLDGSYWMTAQLVRLLKRLNIPDDRILLNLQEGAEEIDAFVDLDGNLLMFELKDSEFSMGHAYPFGGRIGLYKPDIAVIVSTKGIAPEVKDYFSRVKPAAEIIYVGGLKEFDANLQKVVTRIRSRRAYELVSQFEPMANIRIPVAQMITTRLDIEVDKGATPPRNGI